MHRSTLLLAVALLATAPAARAQSGATTPAVSPAGATPVSFAPAQRSGPDAALRVVGARPVAAAHVDASALEEESSALRRRARFSNSQTLMIVGGAAFIAGALIGDDAGTIVMVGGAAVGLYGLYLYLQQ